MSMAAQSQANEALALAVIESVEVGSLDLSRAACLFCVVKGWSFRLCVA